MKLFPSLKYYLYRRAKDSTRLDGCKACGILPSSRLTCQRVSHLSGNATSWADFPSRTKKSPKCAEVGRSRPARRLVLSRGSHVTKSVSLSSLPRRVLAPETPLMTRRKRRGRGPGMLSNSDGYKRRRNERGRREGPAGTPSADGAAEGGRASDASAATAWKLRF